MKLYDAHNHLQDDRFRDRVDEIARAAKETGVARMVVNGSCEADWPAVRQLADRFPDLVLPSFGYHPWYIGERTPDWETKLTAQLNQTPSAVGEVGLDRWKPDLPWEGQEDVFIRQLRIARERNLPLSIHCLKAWGPLLAILQKNALPARGFLLHSFGGSVETMRELASLGGYFSLPGYYARAGKERQRETFRHIPIERMLVETDAPDQSLPAERITHPLPGGLNHPANLAAVYSFGAETIGMSGADFTKQVEANFLRFFGGSP